MTRTLTLLIVALASLTVAAAALGSSSHPSASRSLHVQPRTVRPDGAVHVYGKAGSCAAGTKLTALSSAFPEITFGVGGLTGHVRSNHAFSIHGYVRGNVSSGSYAVTARCGGKDIGVTAKVSVG